MKEETAISITVTQKLFDQLVAKKYAERSEKYGSWCVFIPKLCEIIKEKTDAVYCLSFFLLIFQ